MGQTQSISHGSISDMDFYTSLLLEINRLIEREYLEVRTTCSIQSALVPREGAEQRNTFGRAEFRDSWKVNGKIPRLYRGR